MDERETLRWLYSRLPVGDDCQIIERDNTNYLLTTDMLHRHTDFPPGLTQYSIGWRSVAVSLSDIAAMGGKPLSVLIAYGSPTFSPEEISSFFSGAKEICDRTGAEIGGGDLDNHSELTVVTTVFGESERPVRRRGCKPGDLVAITGSLGRTAAGLELFERNKLDRGNELFRFTPRIEEGQEIAELATAMIDISDGLGRSLHQLAEVNDVGFDVDYYRIPFQNELEQLCSGKEEKKELGLFAGEDYELLFTAPPRHEFKIAQLGSSVIGEVTKGEVRLNLGTETVLLEDKGYVH